MEETATKCFTCAKLQPKTREPLMPSSLPNRAGEKVGTYLFEVDGKKYIKVVDYYSHWIEARPLHQTMPQVIILVLKSVFSQHSIPDMLVSVNGPQYMSSKF